jgi:hypothetical protein
MLYELNKTATAIADGISLRKRAQEMAFSDISTLAASRKKAVPSRNQGLRPSKELLLLDIDR